MLRRPSLFPSPAGSTRTPVLARRGSARATTAGTRRRAAGLDVPAEAGAAANPGVGVGVVPRMRRPRGTSGPAAGQDTTGQDTTGQDTTGQDTTGPDTAGSDAAARIPRGRGTALDQRIEHHLARMEGATRPTPPGTIDDDRARRDPDTTSFAVVRPDAAGPDAAPPPARVATAADRPRTTEFPAVPRTG